MTFREHASPVRRKNVSLHTRDICITVGVGPRRLLLDPPLI